MSVFRPSTTAHTATPPVGVSHVLLVLSSALAGQVSPISYCVHVHHALFMT